MRKFAIIAIAISAITAIAQTEVLESAVETSVVVPDSALLALPDSVLSDSVALDSIVLPKYESITDSLLSEVIVTDTIMRMAQLPRQFFLPMVFTSYQMPDTASIFAPEYSGNPDLKWLEDAAAIDKRHRSIMQSIVIDNPSNVPYNVVFLPDAPKEYIVEVNPDDHTIQINEFVPNKLEDKMEAVAIKKRHWINAFNASLQFSQAYVSPNWYQGGNNNLNALLNINYNVKLNQKYHPKLLFENTFQYKLGINNAPDDKYRKYNITEDLFQINSVFGLKAAKKWYYSVNGQFKTQIVNSYASNSNQLKSAFLSPGELNIGIGMTYGTAHPKKIYTFDASIAPLSYNLKLCINNDIDPTKYGIDPGKHAKSTFGSSFDLKVSWKITYNIFLASHMFFFTDYNRTYADLENTLTFEINKFLTTQLFLNMRYDTDTPPVDDKHWNKFQLKEILSIGFAYKFSTVQ